MRVIPPIGGEGIGSDDRRRGGDEDVEGRDGVGRLPNADRDLRFGLADVPVPIGVTAGVDLFAVGIVLVRPSPRRVIGLAEGGCLDRSVALEGDARAGDGGRDDRAGREGVAEADRGALQNLRAGSGDHAEFGGERFLRAVGGEDRVVIDVGADQVAIGDGAVGVDSLARTVEDGNHVALAETHIRPFPFSDPYSGSVVCCRLR